MEFNIYGIFCRTTWKVYYGKTNLTVEERLKIHEKAYRYYLKGYDNYITSFEILKNNNYEIKLLEVCDDNLHMKIREGYYIRTFPCVNKHIPGRTKKEYDKEYREDNREKIKEQKKEYYEDNKETLLEKNKKYKEANREKILEKAKEYYEANKEKIKEKYICACGSTLTRKHKARHEKSIKHKKYLESL